MQLKLRPDTDVPATLNLTSMKKLYSLCVLLVALGTCSHFLSSCSSNDEGSTPPPALSANSFVYGDAESKIESVVYTVDEKKSYTFYFSPTRGIVDLDAMLLADDYVKIVTTTPTGTIDLLSAGHSLIYKKVDVSSSTSDNVAKAALSLQLTSLTTAKASLDIAMKSGETLRADYNGTCIKLGEQEQPDTYDVTLTDKIFGYYMGPQEDAGTNGYYIAMTNTQWEGSGTKFNLTAEGYALVMSFYGTPGDSWRDMPVGSLTESNRNGDRTFDSEYSGVLHRDAAGNLSLYTLIEPVKIERGEANAMIVTATFIDSDYKEFSLIYEGELDLIDTTLPATLPQLYDDLMVEGAYASAIYNGDIAENGTGLMEISIIDRKGENNEPNGSAMKLALFGPKFANPKQDAYIEAGTYTGGTSMGRDTWLTPVEINIMGTILPLGTYGLYDDGTQSGVYAYGASGDIVVRKGGTKNSYTIEWDIKSITGYSIRGSYTGDIYIENQSSDDKDDGSSTLEDDYEFNLDHFQRAELIPMDNIYVRGIGEIPVTEAWKDSDGRTYGFQHIQLGDSGGTYEVTDEYPLGGGSNGKGKGKLIEGDFMGIDLLVPEGQEDKIFPGTYPIVANRYPYYFQAGVCVPGIVLNNPINGTYIARVVSAIGWGYPEGYFDPTYTVANGWLNVPTIGLRACIYGGSVTIEKAEGGDNWFTFTVNARDVRKHNITGSWTGPFYVNYSDTPVQPGTLSQTSAQSVVKQAAPSIREVKTRIGELPRPVTLNLQPCK